VIRNIETGLHGATPVLPFAILLKIEGNINTRCVLYHWRKFIGFEKDDYFLMAFIEIAVNIPDQSFPICLFCNELIDLCRQQFSY